MKAIEMTLDQLNTEAIKYDNINNEGYDGYNPYRDEIQRRSYKKVEVSREDYLIKQISLDDNSLAREFGNYDEEKVNAMRSELKAIQDAKKTKEENDFLIEWTPETTQARREEWNNRIRTGYFKTRIQQLKYMQKNGWDTDQLAKAIKLNNL